MTTTIKVSNEVRDRLKDQAALTHRTLGQHLEHWPVSETARCAWLVSAQP